MKPIDMKHYYNPYLISPKAKAQESIKMVKEMQEIQKRALDVIT